MSRILAHLTLPVSRVQRTTDRLKAQGGVSLDLALRSIGSGGICAATGSTHDVMRLIGGLADEGEAALLTAETE